MQVVIDIPEYMYKELIEKENHSTIDSVILDGVPLPKGHGDLIDREELLKLPIDKANYPSNYVKYAQAIIEKDKDEYED